MPKLYIEETNQELGEISDAELKVLFANLEEESREDTDYYITLDTVDFLEVAGPTPSWSRSCARPSATAKASTFAGNASALQGRERETNGRPQGCI